MKRRHLLLFLICLAAALVAGGLHFLRSPELFSDRDLGRTREEIHDLMQQLASKPHRAGTPANQAVGALILSRLQESGLTVQVEEFQAEMAEPLEARCVLTFPSHQDLPAGERVLPEDPYTLVAPSEVPYFAYAPDADVEREVIYANFGSREDYEFIRSQGIDPAGKIALVRAQGICRGMKALVAEEQGLAGLLLFPELKDQGFRKPPFPEGSHINPWVAQRGSLLKFFAWPGDPSLAPDPIMVYPQVPALPVSEEAAIAILRELGGTEPPSDWKGWLKTSYRIGPGPARVRMISRARMEKRTCRNIITDIPATDPSAPIVMVGCHYDAWVYGASDPGSGTAAVLETARLLGDASRSGWRPRVHLKFAFWDAEEPGLFGSSRWVRANGTKLRGKLAAYINVDYAYRSPFFVGYLTPGMRSSMDEVLAKVRDPLSGTPLSEVRGEFRLPGFSSDTGPFLGLTGVPVAEIGFGANYPMYHSTYDDLHWMEKFGDPGYRYHATLVQILGKYLQKWTDSRVLLYDFSEVSDYLQAETFLIRDREGRGINWTSPEGMRFQQARDAFLAVAGEWRRARPSAERISEDRATEVNGILIHVMEVLRGLHPGTYGTGGLYGASPREGCPTFPVPQLQDAHFSGNLQDENEELERLSASLESAARELSTVIQRIR